MTPRLLRTLLCLTLTAVACKDAATSGPTPPPAPIGFVAEVAGPTSVRLRWQVPSNERALATWDLRRATSPIATGDAGAPVAGVPAPTASGTSQDFVVTGLPASSDVFFSLLAVDAAGLRGTAAFARATTDACESGFTGAACEACAAGFVRASDGTGCVHACLAANPCTSPPPARCVSDAVREVPAAVGSCEPDGADFTCAYAFEKAGCAEGRVCVVTNGAAECVLPTRPTLVLQRGSEAVQAGAEFSVRVRVENGQGQPLEGYAGTLHATSTDARALLPADVVFAATDAGARTVPGFTFRTAGSQQLTLTDVSDATLTATLSTEVAPGPAVRLAFTTTPADATVRRAFTPARVAVQDAFGNRVPSSSPVTVSAPGALPALHGTLTVAAQAGEAAFADLTIEQESEAFAITATSPGLDPATSETFVVKDDLPPGPVTDLRVDSVRTTSTSLTFAWTAPGDDGLIGDLPPAASYAWRVSKTPITQADFETTGEALVSAAPAAAGVPEEFVATGLEADTTWFAALRVDDGAGNATYAFASGTTSPCDAGTTGAACDACAPGYVREGATCLHPCALTTTCTTPPPATCATASSLHEPPSRGECTPAEAAPFFSCQYPAVDTPCEAGFTCEASAGGAACVAPAVTLSLSGFGATTTAGVSTTLTLRALDEGGATLPGYRGTVAFTSSDAAAGLPASVTFGAADGGVKTVGVILKTAGSRTVTATDTQAASSTSTASTTVLPAAAAALRFERQPPAGKVRTSLAPAVLVRIDDAFGNRTTSTAAVTLALANNPGGATISGTSTLAAIAGLATFADLALNQEGVGITLRATATTLTAATSNPFTLVDDLAPSTPSLTVSSFLTTSTSLTLEWEAPGDDGFLGQLPASARYTLKCATSAITALNFASAGVVVPTSAPMPVGFPEQAVASGLAPDTRYFCALQVNDGAGNVRYAFADDRTAP